MTKKALLVTSQPNYPVTAPIGLDVRVHHLTEVVELYDVAKDIRSQCGELAVLFVDINLQDSSHTDGASSSEGGIALVKWLRIMGVRTPIVVLSDKRLDTLLKENAGSMILASPGTFVTERGPDLARLFTDGAAQEPTVSPVPPSKRSLFQRLFGSQAPQTDAEVQSTGRIPRKPPAVQLNLDHVLRSQAPEDTKMLAPYFKAGLQLSRDAKHDWANWWGMYALLRAEEASGSGDVHYPETLRTEFRDLRNQTALLVHGDGWQEVPEQATAVVTKQPTSRLENRRIVFVDDQADEGWAQVLRRVLYGALKEEVEGFTALSPKPGELADVAVYYSGNDGKSGTLMPALYPQQANANPFSGAELLIMDVRLDTENDPEAITDEISGIRLLRHVREKDPGLPILMFTASQSGEVHRKLIEAGADLVWVKPAIDSVELSAHASSYAISRDELCTSVDTLLANKYQAVRKCGRIFDKLAILNASLWWLYINLPRVEVRKGQETKEFPAKSLRNGTIEQVPDFVIEQLRDCLGDARQLFRDMYKSRMRQSHTDAIKRSQIISRLGGIVELLHCRADGDFEAIVAANIRNPRYSRKDYLGWLLFQARNNAAHVKAMRKCEEEDLLICICAMSLYLMANPIDAVPDSKWVQADQYFNDLIVDHWWRGRKAGDLATVIKQALRESRNHAALYQQLEPQ